MVQPSALMHTPTVALFSARQFPIMWEPHSDRVAVLRDAAPCELCYRENCEHLACMQAITVEEVFQEVLKTTQETLRIAARGKR